VFPTLLELGGFRLHSYGVLIAAGFLVGLLVGSRRAARRGLDPRRITDLGVVVLLAGLVGAKLLLVLLDWRWYVDQPGELLATIRLGGVYYGGLIGALLASVWYLRRHRLSFWQVGDALFPAVALGQAIGRLGCFSAGCCYGTRTDAPWSVTFTSETAHQFVGVPLGVALHPVQLYLAAADLLLFGGLLLLERRQRFEGQLTLAYLFGYALLRGVLEIWRGDERGFLPGTPLSTSQFLGLVVGTAALLMYLRRARRATA
jgi:phosphatidylglycerol:prolipoprotein diacylglycerol transferase